MTKTQRMFFDDLVAMYDRKKEKAFGSAATMEAKLSRYGENLDDESFDIGRGIHNAYVNIVTYSGNLRRILDKSKLFLVNGAVADSLYHYPHDSTNYEASIHLPFPIIFFEFQDALEIQLFRDRNLNLKGMLYGRRRDLDPWDFGELEMQVPINRQDYAIHLFYEETFARADNPHSIVFSLSGLPSFVFNVGDNFYNFSPTTGVNRVELMGIGELERRLKNPVDEAWRMATHDHFAREDDAIATSTNFGRLLDLCVNLIDYINAHNVSIKRSGRETRDLGRINKKREKRGKKPLKSPKPYYWVDIRQGFVSEKESADDSRLPYREWVRGHFQRYHTKTEVMKVWKQPYVRGLSTAPWKENRYRILNDMLRKGPTLA